MRWKWKLNRKAKMVPSRFLILMLELFPCSASLFSFFLNYYLGFGVCLFVTNVLFCHYICVCVIVFVKNMAFQWICSFNVGTFINLIFLDIYWYGMSFFQTKFLGMVSVYVGFKFLRLEWVLFDYRIRLV